MLNKEMFKLVVIVIIFILIGLAVVYFIDGEGNGVQESTDIEIDYDGVKEEFTEIEDEEG